MLVSAPRVTLLAPRVGPTTTGDVIATTSVGKPVILTAQVTVKAWSRVVRGILAVATPGSVAGAFDPANMPEWAAQNPARHLAEGEPLVDVAADTGELTVTFQATEPGSTAVRCCRAGLTGECPAAQRECGLRWSQNLCTEGHPLDASLSRLHGSLR
jgi:hypothetical protein